MKTLFLTLDSLGGHGGIAQFNTDLIWALSSYSCQGRIYTMAMQSRVTDLSKPPRVQFFCAQSSKARYLFHLVKCLKKTSNWDVVLCGHMNLLPLALAAGKYANAPVILFIHGIDAWQPLRFWHRYLVKSVSRVVAVSDVTYRRFLSWAPVSHIPHLILPNTVDLSRFTPGPKDPDILDRYQLNGKKVLLTVGRLVSKERYKGFDEVLSVLPDLQKVCPNMMYVIAGTGDDKNRLRMRVKNEGLEDFVVFTDFIEEEQKVPLYRSSDVYVMPSSGEGFGIVLLEAAACGIPVIGSSCDGSREALLNGRIGELIDPKQPKQLLESICRALTKPKVRPEEIEHFAFPHFTERVHHLLDLTGAPS